MHLGTGRASNERRSRAHSLVLTARSFPLHVSLQHGIPHTFHIVAAKFM